MVAAAFPATLSALHRHARQKLKEGGIDNSALDARLLVEHFAGATLADTIAEPGRALEDAMVEAVGNAVARRLRGEPVHRILGRREFYGLDLRLSPATLEPRPDTETLVDLCLPFLKEKAAGQGGCRILDLGTGTGAIALALLSQVPEASAVGTDISPEALETAAANADILGLKARFEAIRSRWFEAVKGRFTLIVSNPPYIRSGDIASLPPEVRDHDPRAALDGGDDGLDAYRAIAAGASGHLERGGCVAVEIGFGQRPDVTAIFENAGFRLETTRRDLGGHERAMMFSRD